MSSTWTAHDERMAALTSRHLASNQDLEAWFLGLCERLRQAQSDGHIVRPASLGGGFSGRTGRAYRHADRKVRGF